MRKSNGLNGLKIAAVYTAVVLGAGFASGQELLRYFVGYGALGVLGLLAAGAVFSLTGWAVLDICRKNKLDGYKPFMTYLLGGRLGFIAELLVAAFLCVLFAAMLAAGGATLKQGFNIPFTIGVAAVGLLCGTALLFDLEGLVGINAALAPFMVVGGIFIGLYAFFNRSAGAFLFTAETPSRGWLIGAVVYASYNIVTGISVLTAVSRLAVRRRDCIIGGVLGGAALTFLGLSLALPMYLHYAEIISVEIPFLVIVVGYGKFFTGLYMAIMLCAIFTTALSNAFALIEWIRAHFTVNRAALCIGLTVLGIPAAHIGFSNFVGYAYPVFGLIGVFEIVVILMTWLKRRD